MNANIPLDPFRDLFAQVRDVAPDHMPVFLVGGAVRDALLGRPIHDLDFVLERGALTVARRLANTMQGAFYALDGERDTGRVILQQEQNTRLVLDFAGFRGKNLESDLRARDLTINAIAIDLQSPEQLLDPLGGAKDLQQGILRACHPDAFQNDPLRIIRTIRLAVHFEFLISPDTKQALRSNLTGLSQVSTERTRDELFRILDGPKPASAIRILDRIGALPYILPELQNMRGVTQSPPHRYDVWEHSLDVLEKLSNVLQVLGPQVNPQFSANWRMGLISIQLGRYRQQIHEHLNYRINPQRSINALLGLAALYHDSGKAHTRTIDSDGRIRFFGHPEISADITAQRAQLLHLSNHEIQRLQTIIKHHMRPLLLAQGNAPPSRRAIYRFFRDTQEAGVDICIFTLADLLGTYGPGISQEIWTRQLDVIRNLLEAWWDHPTESISPPLFLSGKDLIQIFKLSPGPLIGQLLDGIREGQATGEISSRQDALDYTRQWLLEKERFESGNQG